MKARLTRLTFALAAVVLLLAVGTASAEGFSAEERIALLCQSQLNWLTLFFTSLGGVFAAIGVVFVGFQVWMQWRDAARQTSHENQQKQSAETLNAILQRTAELIKAMRDMTEMANQSQKNVAELEKTIRGWEDRKQNEITDLTRKLIKFVGKHNRFNVVDAARELKAVAHAASEVRTTWRAEEDDLPAEAFYVQGLYVTMEHGDNSQGILEFTKAINSPKAGKDLKEAALLNRGINKANLQHYAAAIEDFTTLTRESPDNLFYQFYLHDTRLLQARREGNAEAVASIRSDLERLRTATNRSQFISTPVENLEVRKRVARTLGSLLIFQARDFAAAEAVLGQEFLKGDLIALWLRLCRCEEARQQVPPDLLAECQRLAADWREKAEPRGRILRGMILAKCSRWDSGGDGLAKLDALKTDLSKEVLKLRGRFGADTTVFSPVSQQNQSLDTLLDEIRVICDAGRQAA